MNLILYGPPGTGKTYQTAYEAVRICKGEAPADRETLMLEYQQLVDSGQIEFVTFHQSYSYEEFVEGLRPEQSTEEGLAGFHLQPKPGVLRRIARRAETSKGPSDDPISLEGRHVFKMSIGEAANPDDAYLFDEALANGYAILGHGDIDFTDPKFETRRAIIDAYKEHEPEEPEPTAASGKVKCVFAFRNSMKLGDLVIVSRGNRLLRAIGEVTGEYEFAPRDEGGYAHRRAVRWLWSDSTGISAEEIYSSSFVQLSIYQLSQTELNGSALERLISGEAKRNSSAPEPFVLIIDEINRANISKVFGELITLIEPDKRIGALNELKIRLPYSRDNFGIPTNLHIIGTMNTADRSIALLDTALRRRFQFRELMPDSSTLTRESAATGIDLGRLLTKMNERIEYLFDREHQVGHAYFMGCESRSDLDEIIRHKVIPLLAEYFYEDWSKVATVLGDADGNGSFIERTALLPPDGSQDDPGEGTRWRWSVAEEFAPNAYEQLQ